MVSQEILGTPVLILKTKDHWLQIQTPDNYSGWIEESSVKMMNEKELSQWRKTKRVVYLGKYGLACELNTASEKSGLIGDLVGGSIIEKSGIRGLC